MILFLNILWFILGGFLSGLGWLLATVLMAIYHHRHSLGCAPASCWRCFPSGPSAATSFRAMNFTGARISAPARLALIGNIVWFILCGWWLAIWHITAAVALGITIIGIPFAVQHVKLAIASLFPDRQDRRRLRHDRPRPRPARVTPSAHFLRLEPVAVEQNSQVTSISPSFEHGVAVLGRKALQHFADLLARAGAVPLERDRPDKP